MERLPTAAVSLRSCLATTHVALPNCGVPKVDRRPPWRSEFPVRVRTSKPTVVFDAESQNSTETRFVFFDVIFLPPAILLITVTRRPIIVQLLRILQEPCRPAF